MAVSFQKATVCPKHPLYSMHTTVVEVTTKTEIPLVIHVQSRPDHLGARCDWWSLGGSLGTGRIQPFWFGN